MRILPYEDFSKSGMKRDDDIYMDDVSITYVNQDGDCNNSEPQTLELRTENNGIARYVVMKTDRFSFDDWETLEAMVKDFMKRAMVG